MNETIEGKTKLITKRAMRMIWGDIGVDLPADKVKKWSLDHPKETMQAVEVALKRKAKLMEDHANNKIDWIIVETLCDIVTESVKEILSWWLVIYDGVTFERMGVTYLTFNDLRSSIICVED